MFVGNLAVKEIKVYDEDIYCMVLDKSGMKEEVSCGQFFNLLPDKQEGMILRRPISVGYQDERSLYFYIKKAGKGTEYLSQKKEGDFVNVMGPLGHGFDVDHVRGKGALLIGGGIGVAPLIELGKTLRAEGASKIKYAIGFNNEPYGLEQMNQYADSLEIYSKENRQFLEGLPTDLLKQHLESGEVDVVYTCGPDAMMAHVVKVVVENAPNTEVQVSLEEHMGCGFGVCLCCSKIVDDVDQPGCQKTLCICKEGPVFDGRRVYIHV